MISNSRKYTSQIDQNRVTAKHTNEHVKSPEHSISLIIFSIQLQQDNTVNELQEDYNALQNCIIQLKQNLQQSMKGNQILFLIAAENQNVLTN